MNKPRDADTTPALVVTFGNTSLKRRPLDLPLLTLGRLPSCDVHLVSPEVAPVHCVLARTDRGWVIRDCSGRPGTRVNGKPIQHSKLDDGDVIQVGAFSFEAHLPRVGGEAPPPEEDPVRERLEASRKRLARLALKLRRKLARRDPEVLEREQLVLVREAELAQQAEGLKEGQREFDLRVTRLTLSERDLATDRATLEREYKEHQHDVEQHEERVRVFEANVRAKEKELAARQEQLRQVPPKNDAPGKTADPDLTRREAELARRAAELDNYARHLRRSQQEALPRPESAGEPAALGEAVDRIEGALRRQQAELARLTEALASLGQAGPVAAVPASDDVRRQLEQKEKERQEAVAYLEDRTAAYNEEAARLRRELAAREAQIERLKGSDGGPDLDGYEAELNRFRQQLEADRTTLDEQVRQVQQRRRELDATVREAEVQLSKERAQIAREKVELLRLRDEVRSGREAKREPGIRERLASVSQ